MFDSTTLLVDAEATKALRDAERKSRLKRGKPFDQFVTEFVTPEPPAYLPYYGSWDDPKVIYGTSAGKRIKMDADNITSMFMPNPKDEKIKGLERQLASVKAELEACRSQAKK